VTEGVGLAGLRERDFRLQRAQERLVVRRRAAMVIELHDVDVADHLADIRFDVRSLRRRRAPAAGEIARHQVVEVVVLDEGADALGVQILVGDRDAAAAQEMSAGCDECGAHAAAEIDDVARHGGLPRHAGMPGGGDVVQVGTAGAVGGRRRAWRLHLSGVAVVVRDAGDLAGIEHLDVPSI
jgi:hypothetical protein